MATKRPSVEASPDIRVLVINSDNSFVHTYPNEDAMRDDNGNGPDLTCRGAVEFFDSEGRRLVPVFSEDWKLTGLEASTEAPDPDMLRSRLNAWMQHLASYIRDADDPRAEEAREAIVNGALNAEPAEMGGQTPMEAGALVEEALGARLPHLDGPGIKESIALVNAAIYDLRARPEAGGRTHPGNWLHNACHAAGICK